MGNFLKGLSELLSNNGNIIETLTASQAGDTSILGNSSSNDSAEDSKNSNQYLNKAIKQFSANEFQTARTKSKDSGEAEIEHAYLIYHTDENKPLGISTMVTGAKGGQVSGKDWDEPKKSLPKNAVIIGIYHSHPLDKIFGEDDPFSDGDVESVFEAIRIGNVLGSDVKSGFFWIADAQDKRYACLIEDFVVAKNNINKTDDYYSDMYASGPASTGPSENAMNKTRDVYSKVFTTSTGIGLYTGSHNSLLKRM
jgi:hypothetical protein